MKTARPQTKDTQSKTPPSHQQTSSNRGTASTMASYKRFCCTDNIFLLPVSGSFVGLLGLVLLVLYLVARGLTTSLYLVEGSVPSYSVAAMLMLTGLCVILLVRFRYFILNALALFLCLGTLTLCLVSMVTTIVVSIPFLESLTHCIPRASSAECQCYVLVDNNSTKAGLFIPGADSKSYTFFGAHSCSNVENTLKDFLYAMCVVYGFATLTCLFSGLLSLLSLCTHKSYTTKQGTATRLESSSNRGRRTSQNSESNPLNSQPNQSSRPDGQTRTSSQRQGNASSNRSGGRTQSQGPTNRPVQRSSSLTQPNSSTTPHQVSRHHSVTTADVQQTGSRSGQQQQRRPPPLIRGGYLQSHVNGPSIPVYTVPGSNEAYIALTDLPSLQIPSMGDVPAYVPDIQGLPSPFPSDEPPPYTPSADGPPPPMFAPSYDMPDIPEMPSPQPDVVVDSTVTSQASPQADVTIETVRQVLGSSGNSGTLQLNITESEGDNTNTLNGGAVSSSSSPQHVVSSEVQTPAGHELPSQISNSQRDSNGDQPRPGRAQVVSEVRARSRSESQSRSVSRSRENTPTRYTSRQEPSLSISQNVSIAQPQNEQILLSPSVTGARPKHSRHHGPTGRKTSPDRNHRSQQNIDASKKRSKSPRKSDKDKGKHKSSSAKRLPNPHKDNGLIPETEIRSPKKASKKTEHRSHSENRNVGMKHLQGAENKNHRSRSSDKKHKRDSKSGSPTRKDNSHKSRKRTSTSNPPKGSKPLRMRIPSGDSSEEETMEGILDLVESVHTSKGKRSKDHVLVSKDQSMTRHISDSKV